VTVILPRRSYSPLLGRFLHDRTADKIAAAVSRIPRSAATIIPFDVSSRVELLQERQAAKLAKPGDIPQAADQEAQPQRPAKIWPVRPGRGPAGGYHRPVPSTGVDPIGTLTKPGRVTVEGRVRTVEIRPVERNTVLACEISDSTGELTALFYGRSRIPGVGCGSRIRFRGSVGFRAGRPFMVNPTYELLGSAEPGAGEPSGNGGGT
jgi:hypothetical protein